MEKEENISPELAKLDAQIMKAQEATKSCWRRERKKQGRSLQDRRKKKRNGWQTST